MSRQASAKYPSRKMVVQSCSRRNKSASTKRCAVAHRCGYVYAYASLANWRAGSPATWRPP